MCLQRASFVPRQVSASPEMKPCVWLVSLSFYFMRPGVNPNESQSGSGDDDETYTILHRVLCHGVFTAIPPAAAPRWNDTMRLVRSVWCFGGGVEVLVKAQGAEGGAEVNGKWTAFIQHFSNQWPLKVLFRILQPARQEQSG